MKPGRTLQELASELDRQAKAKRDMIVSTEALSFKPSPVGTVLTVEGLKDDEFRINDIAHRQFGQNLKIPAAYYDRMLTEAPELLADNVNHWLRRNSSARMLRTMDGTARAFLSDRYRRIDNFEVAQAVLPIIGRMDGADVESSELTDSRMYIKVVSQRITAEVRKGDIVQAGVVISNSEVGMGSVNVRPLIFRLVCTNGMIAQDSGVRKYHVGRTNESSENFDIYRDETIEADDRAFLMKLEDTVSAAVDQARFEALVERLRESTEAKIEPASVPKVVELTSKEYGLSENEGESILGHLIAGGDLSLYGLANAVTRHANDVENYDRATELEATGFKIVTMPTRTWRQISEAQKVVCYECSSKITDRYGVLYRWRGRRHPDHA